MERRWQERLRTYAVPAVLLGAVLALSLCCRFYLVPSESMEPLIPTGSRIAALIVPYALSHEFQPGDVVVFRSPVDLPGIPRGGVLVKRVVASGGDRVRLEGGQLLVNDEVSPWQGSSSSIGGFSVTVPEGCYYLMGDNRSYSLDSRYFGPVEAEAIYGRVFLRYLPGIGVVR